jgi:CheY-like chemotaxis protein
LLRVVVGLCAQLATFDGATSLAAAREYLALATMSCCSTSCCPAAPARVWRRRSVPDPNLVFSATEPEGDRAVRRPGAHQGEHVGRGAAIDADHRDQRLSIMKELREILYVEDDIDIQVVARLALERVGGLSVRLCSSGLEAIDAFAASPPDLVLLDVMMPGMDGLSTLARLRDLPGGESVPIVFMTAKVRPAEVARYRRIGATDVIAKPFDPMTLADQVLAVWRRHLSAT